MTKVLRCRDIGLDCEHVIRANTEDEVLNKAAQHAQTEHGIKEISKEAAEKVRAAIRDE